jgi:hypothetical protein
MNTIRNGAGRHVSTAPDLRPRAEASPSGTSAPFTRATSNAVGGSHRSSGPKPASALLFAHCSRRLPDLQQTGAPETENGFVGKDGDALVFCHRERPEVCIQTGTDVCIVKADGRVFLNGDALDRGQPGFLQMQRRLAELGARVAAGGLAPGGETGDLPSRAPWDPASPAHPNYVL